MADVGPKGRRASSADAARHLEVAAVRQGREVEPEEPSQQEAVERSGLA
jgi:hypothetical protein